MNKDYVLLVKQLREQYLEIVQRNNDALSLLLSDKNLSGIFFPQPTLNYLNSEHRVLIIGQEPKEWKKRLISETSIVESMERSIDIVAREKSGSSKFLQFYKKASKKLCDNSDSAAWANQFCMSYNKRGATKLEKKEPDKFNTIKNISSDLLTAQFEILKPNVAIFTTGSGRDQYIKETFPEYRTERIIVPKRLWYFKIGETHCFRTNHPCAYKVPNLQQFLNKSIAYSKVVLNKHAVSYDDFSEVKGNDNQ